MAGKAYVCGFAFDSGAGNVALIRKNRGPAQMMGHLNGLGGAIHPGESARGAMERTFHKEGGVVIPSDKWMGFHTERFIETGDVVYFMLATTQYFHLIRTHTDEEVFLLGADAGLPDSWTWSPVPAMYNLRYLIPMAQSWICRPKDRYFES